MAENDAGDEVAKAGAEILGKLFDILGRGTEGLLSSPWTGVPLIIVVLSQIDPDGKLTAAFLTHVQSFLSAIGVMLAQAIAAGIKGIGGTLPTENATGAYCVREISIAGIESHKCWTTAADRDTGLVLLRQADFLHLFSSIEPYDVTAANPQSFCVRYSGYLNVQGNQCFNTDAQRADFIRIGLGTHRISNPVLYNK